MIKTLQKACAAALLLAVTAGSAQAALVSYQNATDAFNGNGSALVSVTSTVDPIKSVTARAGGFQLRGDVFGNGVENFVGWCLDIVHVLANNKDYTPSSTPFVQDSLTDLQVANIGKLFNTAYAGLDFAKTSSESAGFQLALWEIIYEDPEYAFDLSKNDLTIAGQYAGAAIEAGQAFLDNLDGIVTQHWNLVFLESQSNQDLVTATPVPVPVPATAGLLLLALGGLAAAGRRRRMI